MTLLEIWKLNGEKFPFMARSVTGSTFKITEGHGMYYTCTNSHYEGPFRINHNTWEPLLLQASAKGVSHGK